MGLVKSKLIRKLTQNYPNFYLKDLSKFFDIFLYEVKKSLKNDQRVEIRGFGTWSPRIQKARISRNPKTGEKINTPEKRTINFKMSKELFQKINNKDE